MDELKWCEQCEQWFHATPRRCPRCSLKWAEAVTRGSRMHDPRQPWPQTPPEPEGASGGILEHLGDKHE